MDTARFLFYLALPFAMFVGGYACGVVSASRPAPPPVDTGDGAA